MGTRSLNGMIRLFVARLRLQCVSPSLKGIPTPYGHHRNAHTSGADHTFEVENTPLLRAVRNRVSEFSSLRSEVSCDEGIDRTPTQFIFTVVRECFLERRYHTCPTTEGAGTFGRSMGGMDPRLEGQDQSYTIHTLTEIPRQ